MTTDDKVHSMRSGEERSKVLHVDIPESVYWHIRQCAIESRMSVKAFVAELGRTASPLPGGSVHTAREAVDDSEACNRRAA